MAGTESQTATADNSQGFDNIPDNSHVELLSDGSLRVEITTTQQEHEPYDIQIQGSDRQHPAIVLRRKHRGKGATIQTISKFGQHSDLYADFEQAIAAYVVNREKRLREKQTTLDITQGTVVEPGERWLDKAIQSVVEKR